MTSISTLSTGQYQRQSPLDKLQSELSSEVASGTIKSSDQDALSSALKDIDAALKSDASSGSTPPAPGDIKSKIDDLISKEVSDGKLTSDQADELKNVFSKAFAGHHGGPGGPGGAGGPPPGGGPGGAKKSSDSDTDALIAALNSSDSSQSSSSSDSSSSTSSSTDDAVKLITDFINSLQKSLSKAGYNATGQSQSVSAAFVVDYQS